MEIARDVVLNIKEMDGKETSGTWRFVANLDPQFANDTKIITTRYEDIDRGKHWSTTQMGKGGIRLEDHGRE